MPGPGDYLFIITPEPIVQTGRLTRLQKDVWGAIYSWERMGRTKLSVTRLSKIVGSNRQKVREATDVLIKEKLLDRRDVRRDGMHLVDFCTLWPEWIQEEGRDLLIKRVRFEEEENGGGPKGSRGGPKGSRGVDPKGPGGWTERVHPIRDPEEGSEEYLKASEGSLASAPPAPTEGTEVGDYEEDNPDGDASSVNKKLEADRKRRRAEEAGKGKAKRAPSPPELSRSPSERWEFRRHEGMAVRSWTGFDLVGYWVCRHAKLRKEEDEEFFVSGVDVRFVKRCARNASTFVKKHLDGDMRSGREAVDAILERAEECGQPVAFAYYFTPKSDGAVQEILKKTGGRRPREKTLRQLNDESGSDRDYWQRKMEEQTGVRDE